MVRGDPFGAKQYLMALRTQLACDLAEVRSRTLWLLEQVPDEYLNRRVHSFYSPIGWHFGHIGRTEEFWILKEALALPCLDDHLSFLFADLPENPKDNRVNLPPRGDIEGYLAETRSRALVALASADLDSSNPFLQGGYAWEFAIQHECQHQETIAEMLQLIHRDLARSERRGAMPEPLPWKSTASEDWLEIPSGKFTMGSNTQSGYDNEKTEHEVTVPQFKLGSNLVTAHQWSLFMSEGGYCRPELWRPEGWSWRESERAVCPEYWLTFDGDHFAFSPMGLRAIHPNEPVMSLSWYEADAYARWRSKRLPSEAEWEYAATLHANPQEAFCGLESWHPRPISEGIYDFAGNAWEWTSSRFLPYPGFRAFPYDGYSKDHMKGGHYVCRGGSWATSPRLLRRSFRNWYVPTYRQGFLGVRLADD